jgi:hypothetical protein
MKRVYKYVTNEVMCDYLPHLRGVYLDAPFLKVENGHCTVPKGYAWDGCTPKIKIFGKIIGTPDGKNDECKVATLWHDAEYQYSHELSKQGVKRAESDFRFYMNLVRRWNHAELYYNAVRLFGWLTWKK